MSANMGDPGYSFKIETELIGTMLVNPEDPISQEVIAAIDPNFFSDSLHRYIWRAARTGCKSAREIAEHIWIKADRPRSGLPSAAVLAIQLSESGNWISTTLLRACAGKFLLDRDKREILSWADSLRDGRITLQQFVDQITLYRERMAIHGH